MQRSGEAMKLERFDEYTLVEKLGHGGMAEVFLGVSTGKSGFRKLFAVKRLHPQIESDPDAVAMFEREASLAARLHHSHVVQTHKIGCASGRHFMAMEYLDGQPLSRLLQELRGRDRTLSAWLAAHIAREALEGLHYTHEASDYDGRWLRLVHRDVSPHNIFVTMDGQIKILDFGVAKSTFGEEHTRVGLIKGKLSYIAPEQVRGEDVDRRADLWSMGVTLWESLAGRRLFRAPTDAETLRAALLDPIPSLRDVAPHVPEELAEIVGSALTRDVEKRFESARHFMRRLDGWLAAHPQPSDQPDLATLMTSLFADSAIQRKLALCACLDGLNTVDARSMAQGLPEEAPTSARPSLVDPPRIPPLRAALFGAAIAAVALVAAAATLDRVSTHRNAEKTRPAPAIGVPPARLDFAPEPLVHVEAASEPERAPPAEAGAPAPIAPRPRRAATARQLAVGDVAAPAATLPAPAAKIQTQDDAPTSGRTGRLHLDSTPYAVVAEANHQFGLTPLDVELPAGSHLLTLRNPEHGTSTTYRVVIEAGEVTDRRIALD